MEISVNGERRVLDAGATVSDLLAGLNMRADAIVVERNGAIVDRVRFADTALAEGDVIELVHMVGGG